MILIKPSYEILTPINREAILKKIELCGRVCYKSEDRITEGSASNFVEGIRKNQHFSVLEHEIITIRFICNRKVTHELVRHRIASFSQESSRYCNYSKDKFKGQITFIMPEWVQSKLKEGEYIFDSTANFNLITEKIFEGNDLAIKNWLYCLYVSEKGYLQLLDQGKFPQDASDVLSHALKTEIIITANLREWQHIFELRCSEKAHPQMRELMIPLQRELHNKLPEIF
jgi:thymidylate synthase (FAD)